MSLRVLALSASIALTVGLVPTAGIAQAKSVPVSIKGDSSEVHRIWGSDRVSTAIFASRDMYPSATKEATGKPKTQVTHVIVAGADNPADSATAIPLAVQTGAPILLTYNNITKTNLHNSASLHPYTREEIERVLRPGGMVTIIGGVDAVSLEAEDQIKKMVGDRKQPLNFSVRRLGGDTRALTSQRVSDTTAERNETNSMLTNPLKALDTYNVVTASINPSKVYAVDPSDANWATALVAGNIAARNNGMVVYGSQGVAWARQNLSGFRLVRLGTWNQNTWPSSVVPDESPAAVDPDVMSLYVDLGSTNQLAFATDKDFPDALVGAAHAAQRKRALVMTDGKAKAVPKEFLDTVRPFTSISKKGGDIFYGGNQAFTASNASKIAEGK
ncbi:cell wall-binding repeat-containing protein [Stomatohabitans albus]|uniref:cell wall-binding repeat-containing protein n=1 Tax=Stomatohabitans albus TaxID=3110766 RepID=UPI00300DB4D2